VAGAVAQTWGPPAGFLIGAGVTFLFIVVVAWQLLVLGKAQTDLPPSPPVTV